MRFFPLTLLVVASIPSEVRGSLLTTWFTYSQDRSSILRPRRAEPQAEILRSAPVSGARSLLRSADPQERGAYADGDTSHTRPILGRPSVSLPLLADHSTESRGDASSSPSPGFFGLFEALSGRAARSLRCRRNGSETKRRKKPVTDPLASCRWRQGAITSSSSGVEDEDEDARAVDVPMQSERERETRREVDAHTHSVSERATTLEGHRHPQAADPGVRLRSGPPWASAHLRTRRILAYVKRVGRTLEEAPALPVAFDRMWELQRKIAADWDVPEKQQQFLFGT